MDALLYLIPIALSLGLLALIGFFWSLKHRQFDDLEKEGWRIIYQDDTTPGALTPDPAAAPATRQASTNPPTP